jgi:transposase-like protein
MVYVCPHCGGEHLQKNGHTAHGAQRAKCVESASARSPSRPRGRATTLKFKEQVLAAYQDRMSLHGIKRTFGVCCQTVMAWLGKKTGGLPAFADALLPGQNGDVLEREELGSFVGAKVEPLWL